MVGETSPGDSTCLSPLGRVRRPSQSAAEPPQRPNKPKGYPRATQGLPEGYPRATQGGHTRATPEQCRSNTGAPGYPRPAGTVSPPLRQTANPLNCDLSGVCSARRASPDTTTEAGGHANRNAGFIRQAGAPHWGCWMNPAFRWKCPSAPARVRDWDCGLRPAE